VADKHAPFDDGGVAGESFDLLNRTKMALIDGIVNLGAVESGKDGVGFGSP
jgi:hypothetical protein